MIGVAPCKLWYWIIYGVFVVLCCGLSAWGIVYAKKERRFKQHVGYDFKEGDYMWKTKDITKLMLISYLGGVLASLAGIGGGTIFGPLLLGINLHPKVSSATAMNLVLYLALGNVIQYMIGGYMPYLYMIWMALFVVIATLLGQKILKKMINRSGRSSVIVLILLGVILLAISMTVVFDSISIAKDVRNKVPVWEFGSVC